MHRLVETSNSQATYMLLSTHNVYCRAHEGNFNWFKCYPQRVCVMQGWFSHLWSWSWTSWNWGFERCTWLKEIFKKGPAALGRKPGWESRWHRVYTQWQSSRIQGEQRKRQGSSKKELGQKGFSPKTWIGGWISVIHKLETKKEMKFL